MRRFAIVTAAAVLIAVPVAGCGSDDDESTTEEAASVEEVTLTADDISETEKTFVLSATPTAETASVNFVNEGDGPHVLIFARLNEGFTVDEAIELQGEKGSVDEIGTAEVAPGEEKLVEIQDPLEAGSYVMLCPIPNKEGTPHFELGQLEEFDLE